MEHEKKHWPGRTFGKYAFLAVFVVTFLTILTLTMDVSQNSPEFCAKCHTMKPQYYTWKASSHSQMGCIDCHTVEGAVGAYRFAKDLARWTYSEVTESYILPIRLFRGVEDEVCFRCHSFNRQATVPGSLIIPHEAHTDKRVRCVSCHSAVAHGDIARRGVTRRIASDQWDKDQGLQQMARSLVQTNKADCMSCHYRRKVTTDCIACHGEMLLPDYHNAADFTWNHGDEAKEMLADCNFCHGWTGPRKMVADEKTNLVEYSRSNRFCISCHRVRPQSHGEALFNETHGRSISEGRRDSEGCLVCHDNNAAELPQASTVTCVACHPSKHGRDWRERHSPPLAPGERLSNLCFMCHYAEGCLSCHYLPGYSAVGGGGAPVLDEFNSVPGEMFQQ